MSLNGYIITCPECGYRGDGNEFDPSYADECDCPECGYCFVVDTSDCDEDD